MDLSTYLEGQQTIGKGEDQERLANSGDLKRGLVRRMTVPEGSVYHLPIRGTLHSGHFIERQLTPGVFSISKPHRGQTQALGFWTFRLLPLPLPDP